MAQNTTHNIILAPNAINGNATVFGGSISAEAGYLIRLAHFTVKPLAGLIWRGQGPTGFTETQQPFGLVGLLRSARLEKYRKLCAGSCEF